jgi:transcriptional regulator with XRE-family HTH domain
LRREEVARLANVSNTYYTFLEQGRATRPSPEVLDALAQALRLDALDRRHLHDLALDTGREVDQEPETLDDAVAALVERLHPDPTYVKGRSWDILAANRAARVLFEGWGAAEGRAPNMLRWMFTDPAARRIYLDWEGEARAMLARFHAAVVARPHEPTTSALIDEVREGSPLARRWWDDHDVAPIASGTKALRHATLGVFRLRHAVLHVGGQPDQHLVTFTATSAADTARFEALAALAPPSGLAD